MPTDPPNAPTAPPIRKAGLVLSGGGARGAYQVGVLKALAEIMPGPSPFRVITGVSVGAINAVVLVEGAQDFQAAVAKLERVWRALSCNCVFVADPLPMLARLGGWGAAMGLGWTGLTPPQSLFDATPLRDLIAQEVDFGAISRRIAGGDLEALVVTAASYTTGEAVSFIEAAPGHATWDRTRRRGIADRITVDHVMASAALPALFQARRIGGHWYGDGALRQTAPLSPAIRLGCDHVLTLSPRDGVIDTDPPEARLAPPSLGLLAGQLLDIVFNDNLDADLARLARVNRTLRLIPEDRHAETALRRVEAEVIRPSADLRALAARYARDLPWALRAILRGIGAWREPWVLPSYLNFEQGYVKALVDLGYADGVAARGTLSARLHAPAATV